jgi:hypothetical protein
MRSVRLGKRHFRLLILLAVLLSATSAARVSQSLQCNPPWGFCYSYCVRPEYIAPWCMIVSFAYFCAPISGGCYSTAYCDQCVG